MEHHMFHIICVMAFINMLMFAGVVALLIFTMKQSSHISEIKDHMKQALKEAQSSLPDDVFEQNKNNADGNKDDTRHGG